MLKWFTAAMFAKGTTASLAWSGLVLTGLMLSARTEAAEVRNIELHSGATGTRAELQLDAQAEFKVLYLANPDRLVLDLPGSSARTALKLPTGAGLVKSVRTGHPQAGTLRVVFDLAAPVTALRPRIESGAQGPQLILEWPGDGPAASATPATAAATAATSATPAATPAAATASPAQTGTATISTSPLDTLAAAPTVVSSASTPASAPTSGTTAVAATDSGVAAPVPSQDTSAVAPSTVAPANTPPTAPPVRTMQDVMQRGGLRPLVIAIDAGHGGQDPGAIGANGTREKDITLQVARELARQVNATPGLKAYLTRDSDYFIPLAQRYHKARAAKADLFVSIHADAFTNPAANGSSVFVLSQRGASSQAAKWLANQENAADLVGGVKLHDKDDTLASVLLDLSQSATMKASEDMAGYVLEGLKALGKTHKPHVERANFVVLRSPDVPSMLVETAFITNPDEERRLRDPQHQQRLARAILNGVNRYFTRQPPPGTLYAARATAAVEGGTTGGSP